RRRTPIGEIQALDAANQLGFDGFRLRRVRQLVSVGAPAQHETSLAKLERNIRKTGCAQPRRQIASEYQTVWVTLDLRLASGTATDASLWWHPNSTQQRAQDTRSGVELSGFANSEGLGIP